MFFRKPLSLKQHFLKRWYQPQGYAHVLRISLPLMVGMASSTVMHVTDRMFLANYSLEAVAAAMPAGILAFTPTAFFIGVGTYANVFIAHYYGAKAPQRIGVALWQGIYFALFSSLVLALLSLSSPLVFAWGGHPPMVRALEETYFSMLMLGGGLSVMVAVLGCFYSGQGRTRPIMLINISGMLLNVPLNYLMINGLGPFPEMGIKGAALATIISWLVECLLFVLLIFKPNQLDFFGLRLKRPEVYLLRRLFRFGVPSGVQFMAEVAAYSLFVFLVGRMGIAELAANNIVFSLDQIAFVPLIGLHVAISSMVGQALGAGDTAAAKAAVKSAVHVGMVYISLVALWFVLAPLPLLELFKPRAMSVEEFNGISSIGVSLLRLVALYSICDAIAIIYSGALKGAGDTRFVMLGMLTCAASLMVAPTWFGLSQGFGIMFSWYCLTAYVCVLGLVYWRRFKSEAWRKIKVLDTPNLKLD